MNTAMLEWGFRLFFHFTLQRNNNAVSSFPWHLRGSSWWGCWHNTMYVVIKCIFRNESALKFSQRLRSQQAKLMLGSYRTVAVTVVLLDALMTVVRWTRTQGQLTTDAEKQSDMQCKAGVVSIIPIWPSTDHFHSLFLLWTAWRAHGRNRWDSESLDDVPRQPRARGRASDAHQGLRWGADHWK